MITNTEMFSEVVEVCASVMPISSSTQQNTGWVKCDKHSRYALVVPVGVIAATGTLDISIKQANTSGGGAAKAITGKAATQLTAGTYTKPVVIELLPSELDIANGFYWVRGELLGATAAGLVCGLLLGISPYKAKVTQTNWQEVIN